MCYGDVVLLYVAAVADGGAGDAESAANANANTNAGTGAKPPKQTSAMAGLLARYQETLHPSHHQLPSAISMHIQILVNGSATHTSVVHHHSNTHGIIDVTARPYSSLGTQSDA